MNPGLPVLGALLGNRVIGRLGRAVADWTDLEWSSVIESLRRVAPKAHGRLLDVGCGDKPYERLFLPYVDSYLGVEHEATYTATNAASSTVKADVLYDGQRLPFEDRTFDTVLSVQVLEHTPHPRELFLEMARVLRDDGALIVSVPFSFRLHEEPHDYFRFTPHIIRELCRQSGLTVEYLEPRGSLWSVVGHKLNSYLGLHVARVHGVAQMMGKLPHEGTAHAGGRLWTLPVVAPAMISLALWARILDRVLPDPTEMLGFTAVARRSSNGALPAQGPTR